MKKLSLLIMGAIYEKGENTLNLLEFNWCFLAGK